MKPPDLAPIKEKLLDYLQDNPVRRAVGRGNGVAGDGDVSPQLSPAGRDAYLLMVARIIISDGEVEPDEIARLYCLFALLETHFDKRLSLLQQLAFDPDELDEARIPDEILESENLRFALARDALFVGQLQEGDPATQHEMQRMLGQLQLTPAQADVMFDWMSLENTLLRGLGAGIEWMSSEENIAEFKKRADAVGLPLDALNLARVRRLSASDITSALKKLGDMPGIGVLTSNLVIAGIAVLIMTGITISAVAVYTLSVVSDEARERAAAVEMLTLQLRAATMLARDIPQFADTPGILRGKSRKHMTAVLQDSLIKMLERASTPLEIPQA